MSLKNDFGVEMKVKNHEGGMVWIGILILLVFVLSLGLGLVAQVINTVIQSKRASQVVIAQTLCEAGIEKGIWSLNQAGGGSYSGEDINLETGSVNVTVLDQGLGNSRRILATCLTSTGVQRKIQVRVEAEARESGVAFNYGVQVGGLGIDMRNNTKISGNVYAGGNVICSSKTSSIIDGDAFVSGAGNRIDTCKVGKNARADSVLGSDVTNKLSYLTSKTGSSAGSFEQYTNQSQLPVNQNLPLTEATIDIWKGWAQDGGTINGNYVVNGAVSLGPKKIDGNLTINNGAVLTLTGVTWVTGNVFIDQNSIIKLPANFNENSSMIIADSPTDKTNYGKVTVSNGASIQGSGEAKSYIMLLSTNLGPTTVSPAISVDNNSAAVVYYATAGMIEVKNNAHLRAITGGGLYLWNNAEITYDTGLADANFSGGPGGSWVVKEWQVIYN